MAPPTTFYLAPTHPTGASPRAEMALAVVDPRTSGSSGSSMFEHRVPTTAAPAATPATPTTVGLNAPNPFGSRFWGNQDHEVQAFDQMVQAELLSAGGWSCDSGKAWSEFADFCRQKKGSLRRVLEQPVGVGADPKSSLERMYTCRNDLALAGLLRILKLGDYGKQPRLMLRRLYDASNAAGGVGQGILHASAQQGHYLGRRTSGLVGGYSAFCFRNQLTYVGVVSQEEDGSRLPGRVTVVGKGWMYQCQRPPICRSVLADEAAGRGYPPTFGGQLGYLRQDTGFILSGIFTDTPFGALVDCEDGRRLRLELLSDMGLYVSSRNQDPLPARLPDMEAERRGFAERVQQLQRSIDLLKRREASLAGRTDVLERRVDLSERREESLYGRLEVLESRDASQRGRIETLEDHLRYAADAWQDLNGRMEALALRPPAPAQAAPAASVNLMNFD